MSPRSWPLSRPAVARTSQSDAGSSEEQQITDVENLITQGADVVIILAQNTQAILPAVQSATDQGIPVIAYDRLIEDANTFYVSFDNVLVGQLMAEVVFEQVPTGNYFIVKGNGSDANSDFLREGIGSVIDAAAEAGDITILEEDYTDNWDPALAQTTVEQWLTQHDNDVQAIVSENDGMATGAAAALEAQGLLGTVVLSGQDADVAALNRVAAGTQAVSVWKDARALGTAAGEAAVQLAGGATLADVEGTSRVRLHEQGIGCRDNSDQHPSDPDPDHPGEPQPGGRRRVDHGRGALRRCRGRKCCCLPLMTDV